MSDTSGTGGRAARQPGRRHRSGWWRRHLLIVAVAAAAAVALVAAAILFGPLRSRQAGSNLGSGGSPAPSSSAGRGAPAAPGATPSAVSRLGASPTPKATAVRPPSASGFPNASNTGVPRGTKLSTYTGPCTITANGAVIDAKIVNCGLAIRAKGVVIKRSKINGQVGTSEGTAHSYTLQDSEVDAGLVQGAAVGSTNMTVLRANIHGGATSVYCYSGCDIRDSWLHGQRLPASVDWHLGAFLANDNGNDPGGRTNAILVHNTIHCDAVPNNADGGCSGNINLYGDFGPITYVTIDHNLFGANTGIAYCVYGGQSSSKPYPDADHVVIINNVFQRGTNGKCGNFGPVTAFDRNRPGNRWENNVWDNGAVVNAAN